MYALITVLGAASAAATITLAVMQWGSRPPYAGRVEGTVVAKNAVVYQRRVTAVDYFVELRTASGTVERVIVPPEMFRQVGEGWTVKREQRLITATSPDRKTTVTGARY